MCFQCKILKFLSATAALFHFADCDFDRSESARKHINAHTHTHLYTFGIGRFRGKAVLLVFGLIFQRHYTTCISIYNSPENVRPFQ